MENKPLNKIQRIKNRVKLSASMTHGSCYSKSKHPDTSTFVRSHGKPVFLFLNPPAPVPVIRDYYCSKTSRSNYHFPPIDFVMQSGLLHADYSLHFIDAVRDMLSEIETIAAIERINPHVIFFLAGAVNYPADIEFVSKLNKPDRIFIGTGDIFLSEPKTWLLRFSFIDAVALDFTNQDILCFLQGKYSLIQRMAYRKNLHNIVEINTERPSTIIDVPTPRHELFLNNRYRFPFSRHRNFSVILTDFGCPYLCSFCVMASLPYRYRFTDSVLDELKYLHRLGVRELFWMNQTFGINKEKTLEVLDKMEKFYPSFSWTTFSRPDLIDDVLISSMKRAGCHTIIFGVESGSEEILKRNRKGYTIKQAKSAFALCRKHKIRTVGTFILGLPGETEETIRKTISLSREIGCNFASFHIAVPRSATELRMEAVRTGKIDKEDFTMDQSGEYISLTPDGLSRGSLLKLKKKAVLSFYLRPGYLLRHLLSIRNIYEGLNMTYQVFYLIFSSIYPKIKQQKE